jgi:hypothetical protein
VLTRKQREELNTITDKVMDEIDLELDENRSKDSDKNP